MTLPHFDRETVKVVAVKTRAIAHVLIRNGEGHKLFEMGVHGVCIALTTELDAEISVDRPTP
jgi:hypothetical protein